VIGKEMKDLDLTTWERVVFYPFGASEGLLLDKLNPNWRQKIFFGKICAGKILSDSGMTMKIDTAPNIYGV
jgi:hypothetical protein